MEENVCFVILFYENGKFFMVGSHAFTSADEAANCAKRFCKFYEGKIAFTYEIEQLTLKS